AVHTTWAANLSCNRSERKGPFGPSDIYLLQLIFPHLQRAVQFHRRFAELEGRQRASFDALDRLTFGILLLDQNSRIVGMNREAQLVVAQNDGLSLKGGGLSATLSTENRQIGTLVAGAIKTSRGKGLAGGGVLAIARPSGKRPFAVVI